MMIFSLLQKVNIEEKIENAPNGDYEIGIFIGTLLPFLFFVLIAYLLYRHHKNRKKE